MAGILLFQPGGAGLLNVAGAQHPAPVTIEVSLVCQLSLPGVATTTYLWELTKPGGSASVLSSTTSAGPSFMPDVDGGSYSIHCFDIDENEYILDIVTPTTGGGGGGGGGGLGIIFTTYASVRAPNAIPSTPPVVITLQCREDVNDSGGGLFAYDPDDTTTVDDDGTVLVSSEGHRYKRILSTPLNVRWFGAKGDSDGTAGDGTDDTAAIQAALDAVSSGGSVYFPPGIYRIPNPGTAYPSPALTVSTPRVRIYGDGPASQIFVDDPGDDFGEPTPPVSAYDVLILDADDITVEGLDFFGTLDPVDWEIVNNNGSQRHVIEYGEDRSRLTIRKCSFRNLLGHVVQGEPFAGSLDCSFYDNLVTDCYNGVNISNPGSKQERNFLTRCNGFEGYGDYITIASNLMTETAGISIYGVGCIVSRNTIKDMVADSNAITLTGTQNATVTENTIGAGTSMGIAINDETPGDTVGGTIVNNTIDQPAGNFGIWCQTGRGAIITGNTVTSGNAALVVESDDVTVADNVLDGGATDLAVQFGLRGRIGSNRLVNGTYANYLDGFTYSQAGRTETVAGGTPVSVEAATHTVVVTYNGAAGVILPNPASSGARKFIVVTNGAAQLGTTTVSAAAGSVLGPTTIVGPHSATYESDGTNWQCVSTYFGDHIGSGTPEGVLSAPVGSTYRRTDGGSSTAFYVKVSGSGNTLWENAFTGVYELATTRIQRGQPAFADPTLWAVDEYSRVICNTAAGDAAHFQLEMPDGGTFTAVEFTVIGGGNVNLPAVMPRFRVRRVSLVDNSTSSSSDAVDASASVGAYNALHTITLSSLSYAVNQSFKFTVEFVSESGANAVTGFTIIGFKTTVTVVGPGDRAAS